MSEDVSIVGGGVVGLSTGAWLELAGYDTRIYTERRTDGLAVADAPPAVATPYAAASIIPHSDPVPHAAAVLQTSNDVFGVLADAPSWPVRQQRHVMVYERDRGERPAFADGMPAFRPLDPDRDPVPTREGVAVGDVDGWSFEPYFVSEPQYVRRLGRLYRDLGGDVEQRRVTREDVGALSGESIVNATGLGARHLVEDPGLHPVKGHLLLAEGIDGPTHDGTPASYNYYFAGPGGEEVPVYAYPREGELVLGGSKLPGALVDGKWRGEDDPGPTITVDGVAVPARLRGANEQLLGEALPRDRLTAVVGYRPGREGGARIERGEIEGRQVVHAYGHGGAGVTYSWGTAALVGRLLEAESTPSPRSGPQGADGAEGLADYVGEFDPEAGFGGT